MIVEGREYPFEYPFVILSEAKDLVARHARSFAEFTLNGTNVLRMTRGYSNKYPLPSTIILWYS